MKLKSGDIINFNPICDSRGSLISLESGKNIPFSIERVYYLYNMDSEVTRGKHAHKELEQVLVVTSGSCDILLDDGKFKQTITLSNPDKGLYIGANIWREMSNFSKDCVIMVLASMHYVEEDYIRDYEEFLEFTNSPPA